MIKQSNGYPCPRCNCRHSDTSDTRLQGYVRNKPATRRRRTCRYCKTVFWTKEVLDEESQIKPLDNGKHKKNETHDDYAKALEKILNKLRDGKTETEINQQKICEIEDLEFLLEQGLVTKEIIQTGRRPKTIWSTVE